MRQSDFKFKKGDWVYYEFDLCQVDKVKEGQVTEVGNGIISTSGTDLLCYPLTKQIKYVSTFVMGKEKDLREKTANSNLNWPDLHQEFVKRWSEMCDHVLDDKEILSLSKNMANWIATITLKVLEVKEMHIDNLKLFR